MYGIFIWNHMPEIDKILYSVNLHTCWSIYYTWKVLRVLDYVDDDIPFLQCMCTQPVLNLLGIPTHRASHTAVETWVAVLYRVTSFDILVFSPIFKSANEWLNDSIQRKKHSTVYACPDSAEVSASGISGLMIRKSPVQISPKPDFSFILASCGVSSINYWYFFMLILNGTESVWMK